jgi:hypothetical protein
MSFDEAEIISKSPSAKSIPFIGQGDSQSTGTWQLN